MFSLKFQITDGLRFWKDVWALVIGTRNRDLYIGNAYVEGLV